MHSMPESCRNSPTGRTQQMNRHSATPHHRLPHTPPTHCVTMNKTLPNLITTVALLPLVALAAPEKNAAPAAPETPAIPPASAPATAETPSAHELIKQNRAFVSELNEIAGSDKTAAEKVAAIKKLEPRAAELGKAIQAIGMQAIQEASDGAATPDFPALKQAMEIPEFKAAISRIVHLMQGNVKKNDPVAVQQLSEFVMHYFQHPQPEQVSTIMQQLVEVFPSIRQCNAIPGTITFFAEIFRANPDRIPEWKTIIDTMPADWKQCFEWSLSYARGEKGDITAFETASPDLLDACWGAYLASGDKKYAEYVLRVACQHEPPDTIDMTIRAAVWSCSSFIRNYPEMRTIARTWFATASNQQKENFALRASEDIQTAVFDQVLIDQTRKEQLLNARQEKARGTEATVPAEAPAT